MAGGTDGSRPPDRMDSPALRPDHHKCAPSGVLEYSIVPEPLVRRLRTQRVRDRKKIVGRAFGENKKEGTKL